MSTFLLPLLLPLLTFAVAGGLGLLAAKLIQLMRKHIELFLELPNLLFGLRHEEGRDREPLLLLCFSEFFFKI